MTLQVDTKYLGMIGGRFRNFKKSSNNLWNCSCPLCGDSKKNKLKARGYFYQYKGELWYKCWNCNEAMLFGIFLWKIDKELHKEYSLEKFVKTRNRPKKEEPEQVLNVGVTPKFSNNGVLDKLKSIYSLLDDHPAKKYVSNRLIPEKFWTKLFLVNKFMAWTNTMVPEKFGESALNYDAPRLVIPFYDKNNKIFAYTGRAFDPKDKKKYILIKLDRDIPNIYGLERIDFNKRVYMFEGPLDSMFIDNAIAMAGTGSNSIENIFDDYVIILDNDKRNKHIGKRLKKLINNGNKVCLWNKTVPEGEDVNDLILSGWTPEKIKQTIDDSTFSGLEAQLEFDEWKKY